MHPFPRWWPGVLCLLLSFVSQATAQFSTVFTVGINNSSSAEFEAASPALADYYTENGDFTEAGLGGVVWGSGVEPANDGSAGDPGFPRGLADTSPEANLYFQLDAIGATAAQPLMLTIDLINLKAGTTHNLEARLNNGPAFYSLTGINSARTLTIVSTSGAAGARVGPNKLTIRRTGGQLAGGSASIEFDYLKLDIDRAAYFIQTFTSSDWLVRPGELPVLSWALFDPAASVSITPGIGNVDAQTVNGIGSLVLDPAPTVATTYTLTATRNAQSQSRTVILQTSAWDGLFELGRDDAGATEFSHEAAADATYFFAGDYSGAGGPLLAQDELLNDDTDTNTTAGQTGSLQVGYPRSLSEADPEITIWFTVSTARGTPVSDLQFSADVLGVSAASTHVLQFSLNNQVLNTTTGITSARLIRFTTTGALAELHPGPNFLKIRRTGTTTGASLTFDYLMLEWLPGTLPNVTSVADDPVLGTHTINWDATVGKTYRVQKSTDGLVWDSLATGFPTGGAAATSLFFEDRLTPPADPRPQYRIVRE